VAAAGCEAAHAGSSTVMRPATLFTACVEVFMPVVLGVQCI
jgi:hypothetical protein